MSGVFQTVPTTARGVPRVPKPPGPCFQSLSLKGGDHINDGRFWPAAPTLHNYRTVFRTDLFTSALRNSIGISLIATVLLEAEGPLDEFELKLRAGKLMTEFEAQGAKLYVPRADRDYAIQVGLRMLALRRLVEERDGLFAAVAEERPLLAYYANSVAHLRRR